MTSAIASKAGLRAPERFAEIGVCDRWRVSAFGDYGPIYQEAYLTEGETDVALDTMRDRLPLLGYAALHIEPPYGWKAPQPRRLRFAGDSAIDAAVRLIRDDPAFGTFFFGGRAYVSYFIGEVDDRGELFRMADEDRDPYGMSIADLWRILWLQDLPHAPEEFDSDESDDDGYPVEHDDDFDPDAPTFRERTFEMVEWPRELLERSAEKFIRRELRAMGFKISHRTSVEHQCVSRVQPIAVPETAGVYIVRAGDRVKIGKAINVRNRLDSLQTSAPHKLELLVVLPGGLPEEAILHKRFAHLRVVGEWFRFDGELVEFVVESATSQRLAIGGTP